MENENLTMNCDDALLAKQMQAKLQESPDFLQTVIDSIPDATMVLDCDYRVLLANASAKEMTGGKDPAALGLTCHQVSHRRDSPCDGQAHPCPLPRIIATKVPVCVEHAYYDIGGNSRFIEICGTPVFDTDGEVIQIIESCQDITSRKEKEQDQLQSLSRLEQLNQLQEELILSGNLDEKSKKITDTACSILDLDFCRLWITQPADLCNAGCIHAEVTEGTHVCRYRRECLHLVSSSGRYTHIDGNHRRVPFGAYKIGRIASGQDKKFLTNQVTTDPRVHNHEWAKSCGLASFAGYKLRDADGRPIGVLAVFSKHPITEEDDAFLSSLAKTTSKTILECEVKRELCEAKNRAEAATRAKSCFLANMSHEIRTPMTAILGFTDIMLDYVENPEAIEAAQTVKRNGEHLLQLINDILDISKIEAGKMDFEAIRWSPRQVVAEVITLLHMRAHAKGLTLRDEYEGPLPETIVTDPTRLQQILTNIVGNAVKFTQTGGIRIVTRMVDADSDEPKLHFDVIDTGIGIPEEQIDTMFEAFTQADGSVTRHFEGTGLGLAISLQIAQKLGGEVTAKSKPGEGSTFTLSTSTGPLDGIRLVEYTTKATLGSEAATASRAKDGQKLQCRILLAENVPDNQRLISAILRGAGAEVVIAQNGAEAVASALANGPGSDGRGSDPAESFDVILMDMQMPILDGYAATRRLRNEEYTRPIVALTAHAMQGDRQKCLDAGCDDYLTKPVDQKKLLEVVASWASRTKEQSETVVGTECGSEGIN